MGKCRQGKSVNARNSYCSTKTCCADCNEPLYRCNVRCDYSCKGMCVLENEDKFIPVKVIDRGFYKDIFKINEDGSQGEQVKGILNTEECMYYFRMRMQNFGYNIKEYIEK